MALRFRRYIKIAPGVKINLSGSGASLTLGPRGASMNFGKRGTYLNTGVPGTGLYSRSKVGKNITQRSGRSSGQSTTKSISAQITLDDSGELKYTDTEGNQLSDHYIRELKKQAGDKIQELVQDGCDKINNEIDSLGKIHLHTDSPDIAPEYIPKEFDIPEPKKPKLKKYGLFGWLFKFVKQRIDRENEKKDNEYQQEKDEWDKLKLDFMHAENELKHLIEKEIYESIDAMDRFLSMRLEEISWPRETLISFEFMNDGKSVYLDVDLPEIEDMPNRQAKVIQRGTKLSIKEMSETNLRKLYMNHIHSVGFRIVGEVFTSLPTINEVVISAYSQRPNNSTGHVQDQYLYSARIPRSQWSEINFKNLDALDITEAFDRFNLIRKMTKTGVFKAIDPHQLDM